ncbi:acyltransferase family protein [Streptomyces griseoruber]|uniref:acyltransferase family protein n=1 Tax=Streptomyces griseoruber TaxID=1943 RepID=UPI000ADE1071|nr:acyltransferase [Streptomyces griseoruber]
MDGTRRSRRSRSDWLDALRAVAALVVVFDHASASFLPEFRRDLMPHFNTSRYGIMVFFLVSGYIIPASLERRGSVRSFWTGRILRLYPLWAFAVGAVLLLDLTGVAPLRTAHDGRGAVGTALAHLTLLQELLGTPGLLLVLWTLSYEMAFYLLVVGLFTVRRHQRSAAVAVVLAVLAAVGALTGGALPVSALSGLIGTGPLIAAAAAALAVAVCCASAGPPAVRVAGGVLGGILALALVAFDSTVPQWESLVILAVMFLGTAVHRAEHGGSTWRTAVRAAAVVLLCAVGSAWRYGDGHYFTRRGWITAFLLAVLTFAAGFAARRRRIPRGPAALGVISYSVYLLHPVLLTAVDGTIGRQRSDEPLLLVAFVAVLLPLCALTYRWIEAPGQAWGRRLTNRRVPAAPQPPVCASDSHSRSSSRSER